MHRVLAPDGLTRGAGRRSAGCVGNRLDLDRGTVDGAAYWPDGPENYWNDLGTSLDRELARYDAILWMQTSAALGIYDGDASNACRFEDADAAVLAGQQLISLWGAHPKLIRVNAYPTLDEKLRVVQTILSDFGARQTK